MLARLKATLCVLGFHKWEVWWVKQTVLGSSFEKVCYRCRRSNCMGRTVSWRVINGKPAH